jgi:hypothetical protein
MPFCCGGGVLLLLEVVGGDSGREATGLFIGGGSGVLRSLEHKGDDSRLRAGGVNVLEVDGFNNSLVNGDKCLPLAGGIGEDTGRPVSTDEVLPLAGV